MVVTAGALLAEIISDIAVAPLRLHAERAGLVLTRRSRRFARRGDDIVKIVCDGPKPVGAARATGALTARSALLR